MLRVLQWNIRGLGSSETDLLQLLTRYDPDLVLLQETWTGKEIAVRFPGMKVFHLPRRVPAASGAHRGGLIIAFKEGLPNVLSCKVISKISHATVEALCLRFNLADGRSIAITNVYFASGCREELLAHLSPCADNATN